MIDLKELRLGNVVLENGIPTRIGITELHYLCIQYIEEDNLSPIDLTEEILLKCGLKKQYRNWVIENEDSVECFEYSDGELFLTSDVLDDGTTLKYGRGMKHLHQLQNLYFALTGEELNVQL